MAVDSDPYTVLGVPRDATVAEITRARRRLSRQYHPDVNNAPNAAARFDEVQQAYNLLHDVLARADYDRASGRQGAARKPGTATGPPLGIVVEPASVDFGRLGPDRLFADRTVTVTWNGARPRRITSNPEGEWWRTVGTAVSASSRVALFHLRAEALGVPDGRRESQFTATFDGAPVTVKLTAEFSSEVPVVPTVEPMFFDTFDRPFDTSWRRKALPRWFWILLLVVVILALTDSVANALLHAR